MEMEGRVTVVGHLLDSNLKLKDKEDYLHFVKLKLHFYHIYSLQRGISGGSVSVLEDG